MNADIQDLFVTARRLDALQEQPPRPLRIHLAARQRDGPSEGHEPFRGIKRVTGQIRASQRISTFDYYSKGQS